MNDALVSKGDLLLWGKSFSLEEKYKLLTWELDLLGNGPEDLLVFDLLT